MKKMNKTREQFITENEALFWYIRKDKLQQISDEVLVEFILNYGDEKSVKNLFDLLGIENVAEIFYNQTHKENPIAQKRNNYLKLVKNFFDLYFKNNDAYRNII